MRIAWALVWCLGLAACSGEAPHMAVEPWADTERVRIHAPDLSGQGRQQDLYLLEFKAPGAAPVVRMLIDVGNQEEMQAYGLPYLQRHGVKHLDRVYITHPHKDHYGGLSALLDAGITVGELVMNPPLPAPCDSEQPWGCDFAHVQQTIAHAVAKGVKHQTLYVDDPLQPLTLWQQDGVELALWFAPHGVHPTLGELSINDTSMFMRLQVGEVVHAFTGDMNVTEGDYLLAQLGPKLKADVLKLPHHGAEGTVSNGFLAAVAPTHNWVPSHSGLWCSSRSQRLRDWMAQQGVQSHVMGLHGDVLVRHFTDRAPVWQSARPSQRGCQDFFAGALTFPSVQPVWAGFWHAVDQFQAVEWAGVPALQVRGWKIPHDEAFRAYAPAVALVNVGSGAVHVFEAQAVARHDVVKHFEQLSLDNADWGFSQLVPVDGLPPGRYELALVRHQHPHWLAVKTGRTVSVRAGGVVVD